MINLQDEDLMLAEKIQLIDNIEALQKERWRRLGVFRATKILDLKTRHLLMGKEIELIRSQRKRLIKLKQSVYA